MASRPGLRAHFRDSTRLSGVSSDPRRPPGGTPPTSVSGTWQPGEAWAWSLVLAANTLLSLVYSLSSLTEGPLWMCREEQTWSCDLECAVLQVGAAEPPLPLLWSGSSDAQLRLSPGLRAGRAGKAGPRRGALSVPSASFTPSVADDA